MIPLRFHRKRATRKLDSMQQAAENEEEARYKPIDLAMVRRLFSWMRPYRRAYVLGISLSVVVVGIRMADPKISQYLIDYASACVQGKFPSLERSQAARHILLVVVLWASMHCVVLFVDRVRILTLVCAGERVQFDLRRAIFRQLQKLSMNFYDKNKLGRIISRCTSDVASLREVNVWGIDAILLNLMMPIVASILLATLTDVRLFLAVCWLGPTFYLANRLFHKQAGRNWQIVREGFTRVSTNLAENITGIRVVTAFNRQQSNLNEFNRLQETNTENNVHASRTQGAYISALGVMGFTGKAIILVYGGYLVLRRPDVTVGKVIAATMYWDWFMNPMRELGNWYNNYMIAMAGGERVFNLLDTEPEVADMPDARPLPRIVGDVQFENVTFGYKPEVPVLHDVSFKAGPGQMIALVGHTGSGKSSIISLIARFYQPQHGRILVDGQDIRQVTGESLHHQMGLVLQMNYLFAGTAMENIRYVRPQATEQQIIEAAMTLGTHDAIMSLKDGYNTFVGERGGNMSLGQRQLICFTRAYVADPRIFMLDEATSAVDTATERLVQNSLEKLLAGRTTFIVAHRLSTIMRADVILVVDQGKIIERGTHRELLISKGKYAQLYEQFVSGAKLV